MEVIEQALENGDIIFIPGQQVNDDHTQHPLMPKWNGHEDGYGVLTIGGTKVGKTYACRWALTGMIDFDTLIVCCAIPDEGEYRKLRQWCVDESKRRDEENRATDAHNRKYPRDQQPLLRPFRYLFVNNFGLMPDVDRDFEQDQFMGDNGDLLLNQYRDRRTYIIVDDMVNKKNQKLIEEYYIKCRKYNCSIEYISQSWADTPNIIKKQAFVFKLHMGLSPQQVSMIASKVSTPLDLDQFKEAYKYATTPDADDIEYARKVATALGIKKADSSKVRTFMYIDNTADFGKRIRKNFNKFIEFTD